MQRCSKRRQMGCVQQAMRILAVNCDVTDRNQVRGMVDQAVGRYGRLDAAFNNAVAWFDRFF